MDALKGQEAYPEIDEQDRFDDVLKSNERNSIEEECVPIRSTCYMVELLTEIETGEQQVKLTCTGAMHLFSQEEICHESSDEAKEGNQVHKGNLEIFYHLLYHLLQKMDPIVIRSYQHQGLGWIQSPDLGGTVFRMDQVLTTKNNIPSTYIGGYAAAPSGDWAAWYDMTRKYCGHTPLAFIIAAGMSSVLLGYLRLHNVDVSNPIIHLSGKRSTSKTAAGMLFLSTAASPRTDGGFRLQWKNTPDDIIQAMAGIEGYPFLIEKSSIKNMDYISVIEAITNCMGKRGHNDVRVQSMSVTVLSTGESSLQDNCRRNDGLDIQLMEFSDVEWTPNVQAAKEIQKVVRKNYGFAIENFAGSLLVSDADVVTNDFIKMVQVIKQFILDKEPNAERYVDRIAQQIALIYLTAIYLHDLWEADNIQFSDKDILGFMLDNVLERMKNSHLLTE